MWAVALKSAFEIFTVAVRADSRNCLALVDVDTALAVKSVTRITLTGVVAVEVDALAAHARIAVLLTLIDVNASS